MPSCSSFSTGAPAGSPLHPLAFAKIGSVLHLEHGAEDIMPE